MDGIIFFSLYMALKELFFSDYVYIKNILIIKNKNS
jgi:hypothetical protein